MAAESKQREFPPLIATIGSRLPQLPPALVLILGLNLARGRVLPIDELAPLTGRRITVRVTDLGLTLRVRYGDRGFRVSSDRRPADLTLRASSHDFLDLLLGKTDADTLFFGRRLLLEGDTDLGLLVKNSLDSIDWDEFRERFAWTRLRDRLHGPLARGSVSKPPVLGRQRR